MAIAEKEKLVVTPFGIEADTSRNSDVLIQSIPGCRLRGAVDASKPVIDAKTGEPKIPLDQITNLGQIPKLPGMQLHVNPTKLTYKITDPLHGDEKLCRRIAKALEMYGPYRADKGFDGVPPQSGTLDAHQMKTLVREMVWLVNAKESKLVKGVKPDMEDIKELPGNFLLNPGSMVYNSQPRYEKDFPGWIEQLTRSGG